MSFRVAARTLLQLGSDLISSDDIAFYELIKNGFDAGSRSIDIEFSISIPAIAWDECEAAFMEVVSESQLKQAIVEDLRQKLINSVDTTAPKYEALVAKFTQSVTIEELREAFEQANRIVIRDFGSGMSMEILEEVYLTIGTRYRRKEREESAASGTSRLTLGEKGVGRLSAMRLGSQLLVRTTQPGDEHWHKLRIDWNRFSHDSDELIEQVPISPTIGSLKEDKSFGSTEIHMWGLRHAWSRSAVERLSREEFSRFLDPFVVKQPISVDVRYNGTRVHIPRFDRLLFESAHAILKVDYQTNWHKSKLDIPYLSGEIDYRLRGAKKPFELGQFDLASTSETTIAALRALGSFHIDLYWYNRRLLRAIEGIGDVKLVRRLLDRWGGGVAVYRDGFRVKPYGSMDDDWLDLDKDAFRSAGYKLNRNQIIARLEITAAGNPYLVDQTNREGLQHNTQYLALRNLVKHILEEELRTFLEQVDEEYRLAELPTIEQMEVRTQSTQQKVSDALRQLKTLAPMAVEESGIIESVEQMSDQINKVFKQARERLNALEDEQQRLVLLAGTGLLVEVIAHELHRATRQTLNMVIKAMADPGMSSAKTVLTSLEAQLQTLRTRLSVIDEVSVSRRQVKKTFDLVGWVRDILENHAPQFKRHAIQAHLSVTPENRPQELQVKMVRGMVVQILENLLSNSVYWLALQRREDATFEPHIWIEIDTEEQSLTVTDNGPGIDPSRGEEIFRPFVTTKPPGEGHGLGLYIAREIAHYHKVTLELGKEPVIRPGRLNTFVLSLRGATK